MTAFRELYRPLSPPSTDTHRRAATKVAGYRYLSSGNHKVSQRLKFGFLERDISHMRLSRPDTQPL